MAQSNEGRCSNRTLSGDYGGAGEGVLLPAGLQFRALSMTHFDGQGQLTRVEHTVINGMPVNDGWLPGSGTYAVNPDCTGTAVVNTPNSPVPLTLFFVVVRRGKEIRIINNAHAISNVFIKVE